MSPQRRNAGPQSSSPSPRRSDATSSNRSENRANSNNNSEASDNGESSSSGLQQHAPALLPSYDFSVGVDNLSLRWPLAEAGYDLDTFQTYKQPGRLLDPDDKFSPYIRIKPQYGHEQVDDLVGSPWELARDSRYVVTAQFNPARTASLANGGDGLCPFDMVQPVARAGFDGLQELLPAACAWQEVIVARIDLARDFAVDDPALWIEQGRGVRHRHARSQSIYFGRDGSAQTLVSGVKGQRCQLYDKPAERKAKKQPLTAWTREHNLRFESQLTAPRVVPTGLGTLERLTTRNLQRALVKVWAESRVGDIRISPSLGQLVAATNLSGFDKLLLLGWLEGRQEGLGLDSDVPKEERTRLRAMARHVGVRVRGNSVQAQAQTMRLDLVRGEAASAGVSDK
jgi:hypothetical protein